jgi:hypothetical protein
LIDCCTREYLQLGFKVGAMLVPNCQELHTMVQVHTRLWNVHFFQWNLVPFDLATAYGPIDPAQRLLRQAGRARLQGFPLNSLYNNNFLLEGC